MHLHFHEPETDLSAGNLEHSAPDPERAQNRNKNIPTENQSHREATTNNDELVTRERCNKCCLPVPEDQVDFVNDNI